MQHSHVGHSSLALRSRLVQGAVLIGRTLVGAVQAFMVWRQFKALEALDDRQLADIGFSRSDILAAQRRGWRDDPFDFLERTRRRT